MNPPPIGENSAAAVIARKLKARGVDRVFGLCGGHIMPIWMRLDAEGIRIIDVRDERAAVYMAHAYGQLSGKPGVALVTAGPGVTNAITGIANAHVSRAPVLVLSGVPPRPQLNRGALQDMDHVSMVKGVTRFACTVQDPAQVPRALDEAWALAQGESGGEPGPAFLDFPTDTLRADVPAPVQREEHAPVRRGVEIQADPSAVAQAADLIWQARRPLVIGGRGARGARAELDEFLAATGAVFLDTGECKGVLRDDHPALVNAMRGTAMGDADLVITIGRKLDFQVAYGSPAVFGSARWVRIADNAEELRDNRRGNAEVLASPRRALRALVAAGQGRGSSVDRAWRDRLCTGHATRSAKLASGMAAAADGADGRMHPNRLLAEVQRAIGDDAVVVADGGDFLAFTRVGIRCDTYLDPGPLGCIGVGTPFGIGAALACPQRTVAVLTGDGAFGFNAMEIDTAARHAVPVLVVVANNGAWQIEVHDQTTTHGKVVGTRLQHADHAAMARAFGAHGERVEKAEDLPKALARALAALKGGTPALLDVLVSGEPMSSDAKSGLAWVPDLQALAAWDEAERRWRAGEAASGS
ncbi:MULTISPECIES: thiamine pyrophosphate-binding protein [unclassified Methylibium]|uniref:thiamine pyrophosphate-binding protein n=1 Tax=unclassified Methylibium TaxID=2633235 RepID=UPI0003F45A65|nr:MULTISPECIES: thiamine pyrophosphate-binding protein [unclassified Methylibium]EWS54631.1 Acetolactate synthase large subunit IlvG [Methylibium sp. T29]EWS58937.1 Acetolactate synthase large subunit IlvG [Methylibium sp. T29-B]